MLYICRWSGKGVDEIGTDQATGIVRVRINPKYYRPTEVVSIKFTILSSIMVRK